MSTKLIYLEDNKQLETVAQVLEHVSNDDNGATLILDQTIFYPQGGGQPYDQGTITSQSGSVFIVKEVRFDKGIVYHHGTSDGLFSAGESVSLQVDRDRRLFNSRNHTAGHLVDIALSNIGYKLTPGKGYHFPQGAYVEYLESIEDEQERETLKINLQKELNRLVTQAIPITLKLATIEELKKICTNVPDYLPKDKPSRVMIIEGYPGIPCGGTHAENTQEIGTITIDKIRNKKGCLRVSYSI